MKLEMKIKKEVMIKQKINNGIRTKTRKEKKNKVGKKKIEIYKINTTK